MLVGEAEGSNPPFCAFWPLRTTVENIDAKSNRESKRGQSSGPKNEVIPNVVE